MEKDQEFDFYREALKAFDAPVPAPKTVEQPPQPPQPAPSPKPEVSQPVFLERPKPKGGRWWIIAICAACIALLIFFRHEEQKVEGRGENWIYGYRAYSTDEMMVVEDLNGDRWYVELNGLEQPQQSQSGKTYLWVFYNGKPKATVQEDCTKKITASTIRTARWYTSSEFPDYDLIADDIDFDIDGDGKAEHFLLYRYDIYGTIHLPVNNVYRLVALDSEGNAKYHGIFPQTYGDKYVFSDHGGVLSLISTVPEESLELTVEDATILVFRDGEVINTDVVLPPPVITVPTVGTLPPEPNDQYEIQFFLTRGGMNLNDVVAIDDPISLSAEDGTSLVERLGALPWQDWSFDEPQQCAFYFALKVDGQPVNYGLTLSGWLFCGDMEVQLDAQLRQDLVSMMGYKLPQYQSYRASLEHGAEMTVEFYEDGTFMMRHGSGVSDATFTYTGRYSSIEDYLYLSTDKSYPYVFVLKQEENMLRYVQSLSTPKVVALEDGAIFCDANAAMDISFRLYHAGEAFDAEVVGNTQSDRLRLSVEQMRELKDLLFECPNWTLADPENASITAAVTLFEGTQEQLLINTYYLTRDGRWIWGDWSADVTEKLSAYLLQLIHLVSSDMPDGRYFAENRDGQQVQLTFSSNGGSFTMYHPGGTVAPGAQGDFGETWGFYVRIGDILHLHPVTAGTEYIQLEIREDGALAYADEMTVTNVDHRLKDGALFYLFYDVTGFETVDTLFY